MTTIHGMENSLRIEVCLKNGSYNPDQKHRFDTKVSGLFSLNGHFSSLAYLENQISVSFHHVMHVCLSVR
jgi:hypothetical protein